jgi:hypothetical protein
MTTLLLFASRFLTVFALGFQQQNVSGGHHTAAFVTSFLIGTGQLGILKLVPDTGDPWMIAAYLAGGPVAIVASMIIHPKTVGRKAVT